MRTSLIALSLIMSASAYADNTNWMSGLDDNQPVRTVSIPGAHDAATSSGVTNFSKTQSQNISGLFDAGVRAFDLRPKNADLTIYHGIESTGIRLEDVIKDLSAKIKDSDEFVIITIRNEGANNDGDRDSTWETAIENLFNTYSDSYATWQKGMTVGDARGKIIVLSRSQFNSNKVGFISNWNHNPEDIEAFISLGENRARLYLQDNYDNPGDATKQANIKSMLDRSSSNSGKTEIQHWVINHVSYVGGTLSYPSTQAGKTNPVVLGYVTGGTGSTGIMLMDFAGDDSYSGKELVEAIIARNTFKNN